MSTPVIEVLWRPGCPYCSRLRRELARAGVVTVEHDIWADPGAAARVRAATGGDETVPTLVLVRRVAMASSVLVLALTGVLWAAGLLRGPVITGGGPAVVESLVLAVLGPAVVVVLATRRG